jgi:hypothetical protein
MTLQPGTLESKVHARVPAKVPSRVQARIPASQFQQGIVVFNCLPDHKKKTKI